MELLLRNDTYRYLEKIKDYISLFWQPAMGSPSPTRENNSYTYNGNNLSPNKENNLSDLYKLDNLQLWEIQKSDGVLYIAGSRLSRSKTIRIGDNSDLSSLLDNELDSGSRICYVPVKRILNEQQQTNYVHEYNQQHYAVCKEILCALEEEMHEEYLAEQASIVKRKRLY